MTANVKKQTQNTSGKSSRKYNWPRPPKHSRWHLYASTFRKQQFETQHVQPVSELQELRTPVFAFCKAPERSTQKHINGSNPFRETEQAAI